MSKTFSLSDFKVVSLRDHPLFAEPVVSSGELAAAYWTEHIARHPFLCDEKECLVVLVLNTRLCCKGHNFVATGLLDTVLCHPREVYRPAIVAAAASIIVMHNHPSGDPTPSENDIKCTRDLVRAGQLLKIELLDHVIMGRVTPERPKAYSSLRELGHFYQ